MSYTFSSAEQAQIQAAISASTGLGIGHIRVRSCLLPTSES
jgi:hypothetical protein